MAKQGRRGRPWKTDVTSWGERLQAWRDEVEADPKLTSAGTRRGMHGQVKTIIDFGLKAGLDQTQIRAAQDRCRALRTAQPLPP